MSAGLQRVLVTGATGFIGSRLCARLIADGVEVVGLARQVPDSPHLLRGDITSLGDLEAAFRRLRPTHVVHLAARRQRASGLDHLARSFAVNAAGTANVTACAAAGGCQRLVVVGTAEEYGPIQAPFRENDRERPMNVYGITKLAGSRTALAAGASSGLSVTVVRPTVAYGPGQPPDMFLAALLRALIDRRPFPMTHGTQTRDFIFIDDLVEGLLRAATAPQADDVINLGSGEVVTVLAAARTAERLTGAVGLLQPGAVSVRGGEAESYAVDLCRSRQILNWSAARSLEEGIGETLEAMVQ